MSLTLPSQEARPILPDNLDQTYLIPYAYAQVAINVSVGDLMYYKGTVNPAGGQAGGVAYPGDQLASTGTEATDQANFAALFCGISMTKVLAVQIRCYQSAGRGGAHGRCLALQLPVADVHARRPVGIYSNGAALNPQMVDSCANTTESIGVVVQDYPNATTQVVVALIARNYTYFAASAGTNGSTPTFNSITGGASTFPITGQAGAANTAGGTITITSGPVAVASVPARPGPARPPASSAALAGRTRPRVRPVPVARLTSRAASAGRRPARAVAMPARVARWCSPVRPAVRQAARARRRAAPAAPSTRRQALAARRLARRRLAPVAAWPSPLARWRNSSSGNGGSGGSYALTAGSGGTSTGGTNGAAGTVALTAGNSGGGAVAGGAMTLLAGSTGGTTGAGGAFSATGGVGGTTSGTGGACTLAAGAGGTGGTGAGGVAGLTGGASGTGATGNGGVSKVVGGAVLSTNGNGGAAQVTGGVATGTGTGGAVTITSGAAGSSSGVAGNVTIDAGSADSGTAGVVVLADSAAGAMYLNRGPRVALAGWPDADRVGSVQSSTPTAAQLLGGLLSQASGTGAGTVGLPTGTAAAALPPDAGCR